MCRPAAIESPHTLAQVVDAVRRARGAGQRVKVVGSGHSFSDIACTGGRMISVEGLAGVLSVDAEAGSVTVGAGTTIRHLNRELAGRGLALENLGDIDRQTIAGAIATATHGTGVAYGGLATFVQGLELVTADGEVLRCSATEEPEVFHCARVGLGALGVVTKVTLRCVPAFALHHVEHVRRLPDLLNEIDELSASHDHFEFYWLPHTDTCATIANNRTDDLARSQKGIQRWRSEIFYQNYLFGTIVRAGRVVPALVPRIAGLVAGTVKGREYVDRSERAFITARILRFMEMEYALPRDRAAEAVLGVRELIDAAGLRVNFPVEVRFAAADDIPLSMAQGRDTCYVAVHMARGVGYEAYFRGVETFMERLGGRPHWAKVHYQRAETLAPRYPEWERFRSVRQKLDPEGSFANAYLDRVLGPA